MNKIEEQELTFFTRQMSQFDRLSSALHALDEMDKKFSDNRTDLPKNPYPVEDDDHESEHDLEEVFPEETNVEE